MQCYYEILTILFIAAILMCSKVCFGVVRISETLDPCSNLTLLNNIQVCIQVKTQVTHFPVIIT